MPTSEEKLKEWVKGQHGARFVAELRVPKDGKNWTSENIEFGVLGSGCTDGLLLASLLTMKNALRGAGKKTPLWKLCRDLEKVVDEAFPGLDKKAGPPKVKKIKRVKKDRFSIVLEE